MQNRTEWDFYFCTVEDKPASIMVDLALQKLAPIVEKSDFIQVAVQLNQPNEYGLTTQGEAEILYIMEDRLAEHMSEALGAVYAGRNTHNGLRTFYFYGRSSVDFRSIVSEVLDGFPNHRYNCDSMVDAEWTFFLQFLYPSPIEYQSILNRRVIEKLQAQGIDPGQNQEVEHFLNFKTESARELFLEQVVQENFKVVGKGYRESGGNHPFNLILVREDQVDSQSIDAVVLYLIQLAESCQGEYDGWGTGVLID